MEKKMSTSTTKTKDMVTTAMFVAIMLQKRRFNIVLVSDNNQQGISLAKAPKGKIPL